MIRFMKYKLNNTHLYNSELIGLYSSYFVLFIRNDIQISGFWKLLRIVVHISLLIQIQILLSAVITMSKLLLHSNHQGGKHGWMVGVFNNEQIRLKFFSSMRTYTTNCRYIPVLNISFLKCTRVLTRFCGTFQCILSSQEFIILSTLFIKQFIEIYSLD